MNQNPNSAEKQRFSRSDATSHTEEGVCVLLSLAPPDGTTRFVDQLVSFAHPGQRTKFFSWQEALLGRYDIFHVHWPEYLVRSPSLPKKIAKHVLFIFFLARIALFRIPVVRTVHNITPHEPGSRFEQCLMDALDRNVTERIVLNPLTPVPNGVLIPHGHYVERFAKHPKPDRVDFRIAYFGILKPYKNVESLIEAFQVWQAPYATLRIIGNPTEYTSNVVLQAGLSDPRISTRLEFAPDEDLVREICESELVVLPYSEMHNSGALLVALSLARPVLTPDNPMSRWIRGEVGEEWVITYSGRLTSEILSAALASAREIDSERKPNLTGRNWEMVAERHYDVYIHVKGGK